MEKEPKVSVLIPAYNAQDFIQRAINSVLTQTFKDLEVVVIDDGSKDLTAETVLAMQRQDRRIRYYYQENNGLSNTRNRLVELARGEFAAFLDHDDEWLPQKLEKQLKIFEKDKNIGLVFSDIYIKNNGRIVASSFKTRRPFRGYIFYRYLFSDNFVPLITAIIPKKILLKFMPFNPKYETSEEFDVFLNIAHEYKFDYINEPLAIYHLHGNNTAILKWHRLIEEELDILNAWLEKKPQIRKIYKRQLNKRLAQLYCKEGRYFLSKKNMPDARKAIFNSFRHNLLNLGASKLTVKLFLDNF